MEKAKKEGGHSVKDFTAALSAAKDARDPDDYVRRVKHVVRDEILALDPNALIEDTNYFSHSAIPDFVISWRKDKIQRSVFLRDNLENVVAARDAEFIPDEAPALITLDNDRADAPIVEKLTSQMSKRPDALVTSATTLDVIDDKKLTKQSPVSDLVRSNFIRGAKGWINSADAELLVNSETPGPPARDEAVKGAIERHFQPDAATRISRAAALLSLAGGATWWSDELKEEEIFAGKLNDSELRSILPWLLREDQGPTAEFWKKFGAMFGFADLEKLYEELKGFDLTALIEANKGEWGVKRAYAGIHIGEDDPLERRGPEEIGQWSFFGRAIGKSLPQYGSRLHVSHSGTKLPGRGSATSTTWESLEPVLITYKLVRVELKGLRRSVTVNAEDSDDIRWDISEIANSLEDTYYVQSVTVKTDSIDEGTVETQIDFGKSLAVSNADTTLDELTSAVEDILIRRH
jgi:hypothetical protein